MPRKKDVNEESNTEHEYKQMILKVNAEQHEWLRTIAENTELALPKVVDLVLGDAIKKEPKAYIDQIKKLNAKEALKRIEAEQYSLEAERKRLTDILED